MEKLEKIPEYGDLMTIERFSDCVKSGSFIDYDGYGYWATETQCSSLSVKPSQFYKSKKICGKDISDLKPEWATHIVWFNR